MLESTCPELFDALPVLRLELGKGLSGHRSSLSSRLMELVPSAEVLQAGWLKPCSYRILAAGEERGRGTLHPGRLLATGDPERLKLLGGKAELDPVRALPCRWIAPRQRRSAERLGIYLLDPTELLWRHVQAAWGQVLADRHSLDQVRGLLDQLLRREPALVQSACRR
ncbi:MAG: FHIPEP family type III secretion protein, partial [Candidatus Eremiobacterota bacterium]